MTPKKFEVLEGSDLKSGQTVKAGDIVYDIRGYDYGLASDDTRIFGEDHKSVTWESDGSYPSFTIPKRLLKEIV